MHCYLFIFFFEKKKQKTKTSISCDVVFMKHIQSFQPYNYQMFIRVATAQEKQGIWLLTFPDRENTGNLVNLIFYTWKILLLKWQQGGGAFLS